MTPRLKTVSKIARIIDHQKEVIEFQVREIAHQENLEREKMTILEKGLHDNIDRFEERLHGRIILNRDEVTYLFEVSSNTFHKMELKKRELDKIGKELETLRALFGEAYKKKKAIEIVQNKIKVQERKSETVLEQKNLDYLNLSNRSRP